MIGTRGQYHLSGPQISCRGFEKEPSVRTRLERIHIDSFSDWSLKGLGIRFEIMDQVVPWHEGVWFRAIVESTGQPKRPVRQDKAETVPASPPALPHLPPLKDYVLSVDTGELMAQTQPCLPGSDYHDVVTLCQTLSPSLSVDSSAKLSESYLELIVPPQGMPRILAGSTDRRLLCSDVRTEVLERILPNIRVGHMFDFYVLESRTIKETPVF